MIVGEAAHRCSGAVCELAARVRSEAWTEEDFTLWYRVPADLAPDHDADAPDCSPFLVGLLLWCLRRGEPLRIEGRVSRRLLENAPLAADICRAFWPEEMTPVEVEAEAHEPSAGTPVVASFFTRGVDSWYTALTHGRRRYDGSPLTHLVYVPSVDFMFDEAGLARSIEATSAAARAAGMSPVVIESNLRQHTERFLHWGYYHGPGLAGMGLALGASRVLLPAARSYGYLEPEGSHPLLDPLWSTERSEVVHHGAEATRWEKVQFLTERPLALGALKVCFDENTDGNCGRCPKCVVTMLMLAANDVLDVCPFDAPLDPRRVARLDLPGAMADMLREQVLPAVKDARLAFALEASLLREPGRATLATSRAAMKTARRALSSRVRRRTEQN